MEVFILKSTHRNLNLVFQIANLEERQIKKDLCRTFFSNVKHHFIINSFMKHEALHLQEYP